MLLSAAATELPGMGTSGRCEWGPLSTLDAEYPLGGRKALDNEWEVWGEEAVCPRLEEEAFPRRGAASNP